MERDALAQLLQQNYLHIIDQIRNLSDRELLYAPKDKWNAIQQLDHLIKSVAPVNMAMGLPKFVLSWKFGIANRPSRSYEALVDRYHIKLQAGGRASGAFIPPLQIDPVNKEVLLKKLQSIVQQLVRKTQKQSEVSLDRYILPHPLLGKLTLREMLYFTAYHASHHGKSIEYGLVSLN
ncbi:MAG: DinB family protein [Chitinophagaceae bacterium]|nr:DinB family protein [Chitinophagaceae bacterium]